MKRSIVIAATVLTAFQRADSQAATPPVPLRITSAVAELRVVATTHLPANPQRKPVDEYCSAYAVSHPKTPGGRLAIRKGWIVTSETKLGTYDAVTFVGALEDATSATCFHLKGNLGIFDGPQLKAIAYRPHSASYQLTEGNDGIEDSLGSAEQIDRKRIRLNPGLPGSPLADVVLRDSVSIEPIAKEDRVCGGAAAVPNLFADNIFQARKKLRSYGWMPARSDDAEAKGEALYRRGVIEVEACSGTGYGFCAFNYRHKKGFGLRIISAGEEYGVMSYEAYCGRPKRHRSGL